jgi:hypothetical protein
MKVDQLSVDQLRWYQENCPVIRQTSQAVCCSEQITNGSRPPQDQKVVGSNPAGVQGFQEFVHCTAVVHNLKCIVIVCI